MNTLPFAARVIATVTAVSITLGLLNAVFAIAEPQRSVLIAKLERHDAAPTASVAVAMAATPGARLTK
jgi:hypothetical protein